MAKSLVLGLSVCVTALAVPSVPLYNAAVPGTLMPIIGLGTGGYGNANHTNDGEYWDDAVAYANVKTWLQMGGRRIDTALDYLDQVGVGNAIKDSGVPRSEIFITSKIGPRLLLGYNETLQQTEEVLLQLQTDYVDLLLVHWPALNPQSGPNGNSSTKEPPCKKGQPNYKNCRQQTWQALEKVFRDGKARAIGVSNFEPPHIEDIKELNSLMPAVNQVEFHPYWHEDSLVQYCRNLSILFNGYASFGTPDYMLPHWGEGVIGLDAVKNIAAVHNITAAQTVLLWSIQQGLVVNPRSMSVEHQKENLNTPLGLKLSPEEMSQLSSLHPPGNITKVCPDPNQMY